MKDEQTFLSENEVIKLQQDLRKSHDHIVDSINLLIFIFLMVLVVLTIWLFKHKRFPYVHETGLAIIYGMIFGIVIKYCFTKTNKITLSIQASNINLTDLSNLPEYVELNLPNHTQTFLYYYNKPKRRNDVNSEDYEEKITFDPEIFFNLLLPPIIFQAGYSMKRKHFFKNFGAILMFALLGTTISCLFTGGFMYVFVSMFKSLGQFFTFNDCLFFGAIISATDPVTVLAIFNDQKVNLNLYALVFGESVLNDAVSIILANAIEQYSGYSQPFNHLELLNFIYNIVKVFLGAFSIGFLMGCVTALLTKFTHIRQHPSLETALFILMSYSTFLASEAVGFTGIISVLFCGIFQAHYTYNNLSKESQIQTKEIFNLLNFLSENFIFIYIGISMFSVNHQWNFTFIIPSIVGVTLARAINIYPLAYLINLSRSRKNKINLNMQHLMVFSGLRGAMAFALAIRNTSTQARKLILTTTSIIVILTVILCGGLTSKMLSWLGIKTYNGQANFSDINDLVENDDGDSDNEVPSKWKQFKAFLGKFGIFKAWRSFDNSFMKPLLTNSLPTLIETMPRFCFPVSNLLTTNEQVSMKDNRNNHGAFMKIEDSNDIEFSNSRNNMNMDL